MVADEQLANVTTIAGSGTLTMQEALVRFKSGTENITTLLQDLLGAVERERQEVSKAQEQVIADRTALQDELERVQSVLSPSEQVVLNVGGHKFTTTIATLRNAPEPSLFNAMFSGRHQLQKDSSGCIFLDRDGRWFSDVLNYLRDGCFNYPPDGKEWKYLLELRAEANFYGLSGLVTLIDRLPYGIVTVTRAAHLNADDSWMYEDGQDEVVISVDKPCQLLGVGLCGTEGSFFAELEVYEVQAEDFSVQLGTSASASQSFTRTSGKLVQLMLPTPAALLPDKVYMLSALIKGTESACSEDCLHVVVAGGVRVQFHTWESANGTNETRGQFPELYIRPLPGV